MRDVLFPYFCILICITKTDIPMKKQALHFLSLIFITLIMTASFSAGAFAHSNGAPQAKTGSPGDGSNCTS